MVPEHRDGYVFITEGETEKEFYLAFLSFLCKKHNGEIQRLFDENNPDIEYQIVYEDSIHHIKFHSVNCITQMPRSGAWFHSQCYLKYKKVQWHVFLCYDTDSYLKDVSKFYEGDWDNLRKQLKKADIIDVAASADIEDIMLTDLAGVCSYLQCEVPESLRGRKGKVRMKNLFRDNGQAYHEGKRARDLINSLDMQIIIDHSGLPLNQIESMLFRQKQ